MAKPLNKPQPQSSVSNMLDMAIGAAAISTPPKSEPIRLTPVANEIPAQPVPRNVDGESANIYRQFILTSTTDAALKKIIGIYSTATGIDLKASEVIRAVLVALEHAAPELEREAAHIGRLKRHKNERGKEALREQLERKLARAIIAGTRATNVLSE